MGILGSVFDSFFDGLAIDILRNSNNKSPKPKKSQERQSVTSLKTWASHFDTSIDKDFTEYDWFDFYPSDNCHDIPSLHPNAFLTTFMSTEEDITKKYLQLEEDAVMNPYDIKAQCDFIQYCFILVSLSAYVDCESDELEYDSQYAPDCLKVTEQLYEKIHRSIYNVLFYDDNSPSGKSRKCTMCILDAEIYLDKGDLVKSLKRYYRALQYGTLEQTTSYGHNKWNNLQSAVLSNIAGLYNFADLNEKSSSLFRTFPDCIRSTQKSYRELMNGAIRGSEKRSQYWLSAIQALDNPSQLGFHWTYFAGNPTELGEIYNVGDDRDGQGWPITLDFCDRSFFEYYKNKYGDEWAESQKDKLRSYVLG